MDTANSAEEALKMDISKDEETLLRADETNITIVLHSAEYGCSDEF